MAATEEGPYGPVDIDRMGPLERDAHVMYMESRLCEIAATAALEAAKGILTAELFAWLHSSKNPARCTVDHRCDYSDLRSKLNPGGKQLAK